MDKSKTNQLETGFTKGGRVADRGSYADTLTYVNVLL